MISFSSPTPKSPLSFLRQKTVRKFFTDRLVVSAWTRTPSSTPFFFGGNSTSTNARKTQHKILNWMELTGVRLHQHRELSMDPLSRMQPGYHRNHRKHELVAKSPQTHVQVINRRKLPSFRVKFLAIINLYGQIQIDAKWDLLLITVGCKICIANK